MATTANHLKYMAIISVTATALSGCSDSFMKASPRSRTSALAALSTTVDDAGNISATFDPNAGTTQVLKFSTGTLAGSAIAIPPGSLALPVSITVGEGETLTSTQFLQNLGITNNTVTAAGPSVSFVPSTNVEATNPFTLSIPLSITSLALAGPTDNIVVMYRWMKVVNGEPSYSMGIIPGDEVVISNNKVSFQTTKFGVFQLGKAETKITERVNVATIQPPALKKDASNPLIGSWGICSSEMSKSESSWATDPVTFERVIAGARYFTLTPNTDNHNGGVKLSWRGGMSPFKVERSTTASFSSPVTLANNYFDGSFDDQNLPSGLSAAYYRVTDASGQSSVIAQPVPWYIEIANVISTSSNATITWISNGTSFEVTDWPNSNCSGTPTTYNVTTKTYNLAFSGSATKYVSIKDTNSQAMSQCLTLTPRPNVDIVSLKAESKDSSGKPRISLVWNKSANIFDVYLYQNSNCTSPDKSWTSLTDTSLIIDGVNFSTISAGSTYWLQVKSQPPSFSSQCMPITIPPASGSDILVDFIDFEAPGVTTIAGKVVLGWSPAGDDKNYSITRYSTANCSGASYVFNTYNQTYLFVDNYPTSGALSYKVQTTGTTIKSSVCLPVTMPQSLTAMVDLTQPISWRLIDAKGDRITVRWHGDLSGKTIYAYKGTSCTASPEVLQNISSNQFSQTYTQLPKASAYSFEIPGLPTGLPCITVSTTSFSPFLVPVTATSVQFTAKINVKSDGTYKLILASPQDPNYELNTPSFSMADTNTSKVFTLASPDIYKFQGSSVTVKAPYGCMFLANQKYRSEIVLTNENTNIITGTSDFAVNIPDWEIICSGSKTEGNGGGSLGITPNISNPSKKMNLIIANGSFTMIEDFFQSTSCSENRISSRTELGTLVLPGQDSVENTYPVDVTSKDISGILFTDAAVEAANTYPDQFGCGIQGWVKNKSQSLNTSKCADLGKTDYLRLKVVPDKTVGDRLYVCDPPDKDSSFGKTAATRIPTCDITASSFYFKRQ